MYYQGYYVMLYLTPEYISIIVIYRTRYVIVCMHRVVCPKRSRLVYKYMYIYMIRRTMYDVRGASPFPHSAQKEVGYRPYFLTSNLSLANLSAPQKSETLIYTKYIYVYSFICKTACTKGWQRVYWYNNNTW